MLNAAKFSGIKFSRTDLSAIICVALMSASILITAVDPVDAHEASSAVNVDTETSSPVVRYLA